MREPISSLRSLWARPGFLVRRLHQISVAIFLDEMAALELTPVQYGALMIVAAKPNIDQSTLAAELGVDRANAGDVLARMSKAGYVTRTPSANDRRFIQIKLTAEGTALLRKASARAKKVQDRLLKPLAPSDRDVFIALMTQIINGNDHFEPGAAAQRTDRPRAAGFDRRLALQLSCFEVGTLSGGLVSSAPE